MKVLVTGDRGWSDVDRVVEVMQLLPSGSIVVHGACRGADVICAVVAEALGFIIRPYPADWAGLGRRAGPIRNQQMIDAEHLEGEPIDLCLGFHNDIASSRGTADMLRRAAKARIPCRLITSRRPVPT